MIVFCAGLRSSGSTLQWQIANEIVGQYGFVVNRANQVKKYLSTGKIAVAKQHKLTFENYIRNSDAKILMTVRDLRDVQASLMMRWHKSFEYCFNRLKVFVAQQSEWMQFRDKMYLAHYEQWVNSLEQEAHNIAMFIGVENYDAVKIAEKYSLENNKLRLGEKHITDAKIGKYKYILTQNQIAVIENEFSEWLSNYGYS